MPDNKKLSKDGIKKEPEKAKKNIALELKSKRESAKTKKENQKVKDKTKIYREIQRVKKEINSFTQEGNKGILEYYKNLEFIQYLRTNLCELRKSLDDL